MLSGLDAAQWPGLPREAGRHWVFGDLQERVEAVLGGVPVVGYPALWDGATSVSVRVFGSPTEARAAHREGLLRLFLLDLAPQLRALERRLPGMDSEVGTVWTEAGVVTQRVADAAERAGFVFAVDPTSAEALRG